MSRRDSFFSCSRNKLSKRTNRFERIFQPSVRRIFLFRRTSRWICPSRAKLCPRTPVSKIVRPTSIRILRTPVKRLTTLRPNRPMSRVEETFSRSFTTFNRFRPSAPVRLKPVDRFPTVLDRSSAVSVRPTEEKFVDLQRLVSATRRLAGGGRGAIAGRGGRGLGGPGPSSRS